MRSETTEILIIGAGPAGSVAAGLLRQQGRQVLILEREQFPRFSIGESLLPQSMVYIEQAGMLRAVVEAGFQYKNGASFVRGERNTAFDFRDKFSPGWGTTYQVQRADFDHVLAKEAERMGAEIRYRHEVIAAQDGSPVRVEVRSPEGEVYAVEARFMLDASGFGRILPRLLGLDRPSSFPSRSAVFTHVQDGIAPGSFDRNKIRIGVHPEQVDVWSWLIPFSNGRCSLGFVARSEVIDGAGVDPEARLKQLVSEDPPLAAQLAKAQWDTPVRQISSYASNVSSLHGEGFALLGNAGEFLDPVFSSGVTIAFTSSSLAARCIERRWRGEAVDWEQDFAVPLRAGIDTFRAFVESWYAGGFQQIIFYPRQQPEVRRMICSILAGYAWDRNNPYVAEPKRRLAVLEQLCV